MWKDKLKGLFQDVCREMEDACEDVKEKVEKAEIGDKLKKVGEDIKEEVERADIGEKLRRFGEEIKTQFTPSGAGQGTSATNDTAGKNNAPAVVIDVTETVEQEPLEKAEESYGEV